MWYVQALGFVAKSIKKRRNNNANKWEKHTAKKGTRITDSSKQTVLIHNLSYDRYMATIKQKQSLPNHRKSISCAMS